MSTVRIRDCWRALLINGLLCASASADGLRDALQAALDNHPAVAGQRALVDAKRRAADAVRSQRYPTVVAQAERYGEGRSASGEDLSQPYAVRVRQPIWAFGRIDNDIAAANADVRTERADLTRVRRELLEKTAVAYASVRGKRQQIDMAAQNVTQLETLFEQIQRRVTGQLASPADARLAAARLADARAELERSNSEFEDARDALMAFTQAPIGTDEPVPAELLDVNESTDLVERAIDRSADVGVVRRKLERAEVRVDQAKTAHMPTIYLQADRYYDQPGLNDDSQAGVVFEGSLDGLGFAARGHTGEAIANRTAATQDLAATKIDVTRDVTRLQRNRRLQADLIGMHGQSLDDLESLLASYQRQYESGTKSWLDLLNVQRELFEQRRQRLDAQTAWQVYTLQLLAKVGDLDGWAGLEETYDR